MSNKSWDKLNPLDQQLRRAKPQGMTSGVKLTIEMIGGFELFNTRPYHNYDTWSDGYRVSDGNVTVEAEDLDDAIQQFIEKTASVGSPSTDQSSDEARQSPKGD